MKHTYSAGGIILNENSEILLIDEGGRFYGFPKGRREVGEENIDTAKREIKEEAGVLSPVLLQELGTYERHPFIDGKEDTSELKHITCLLYTSPSPRDGLLSRMPSSA